MNFKKGILSDEMRKSDAASLNNIRKVRVNVTPRNRIQLRLIRSDKDGGMREKDVKNLIGSANSVTRECTLLLSSQWTRDLERQRHAR